MSEKPAKPRVAPRRKKPAAKAAIKPAATPAKALSTSERPVLFRGELPVRWRDLDAFNHVNNSMFLTYVEEVRLRWMESLPEPWVTEFSAPVLASVAINFRRPIEWPAVLSIELYADRLGNSSIDIGYRIVAAGDPATLYADGNSVMVWADKRTGKGSGLPAVIRAAATP